MPRITANSGTLLSVTFYADESPTNADGSVTVTLTTPAGTPLVSTTATSAGNGTYTYVLAPQATPVLLNVLWSGTFGGVVQSVTDTVEVVGARLFSLADARASDVMLADTSRYTTAKLEQARLYVEDEFRSICSVSFIPTYHREIYDGPGVTRSI